MKVIALALGIGLIFVGLVLAVYGYVSSSNLVSSVGERAYNPAYVYHAEWQGFQVDFYLGLAVGFIGIVLAIYGALSSKKIPPPPSNSQQPSST